MYKAAVMEVLRPPDAEKFRIELNGQNGNASQPKTETGDLTNPLEDNNRSSLEQTDENTPLIIRSFLENFTIIRPPRFLGIEISDGAVFALNNTTKDIYAIDEQVASRFLQPIEDIKALEIEVDNKREAILSRDEENGRTYTLTMKGLNKLLTKVLKDTLK